MSNTPIMYSSHDVGAPQVKDVAINNRHAQSLKNILVPALVTGYGDKPAAGWKLVHEHEFGFTLSNGDGTFFVNFVSNLQADGIYPAMNGQAMHIYAATSFSGAEGPKMIGSNLCSGDYRADQLGPDPMTRHTLGYASYPLWSQRASASWSIVADKDTFTFNISSDTSTSRPESYSFSIYAGKIMDTIGVASNVVLGGSLGGYQAYPNQFGLGEGVSLPINLVNGLSASKDVIVYPDTRLAKKYYGSRYQLRSSLYLIQPQLLISNQLAGQLRGVVNDPIIAEYSSWEDFLAQLGFDPELINRNKRIEIGGHLYCYARHASCGGMYMTNNPEFW